MDANLVACWAAAWAVRMADSTADQSDATTVGWKAVLMVGKTAA